MRVPLALALTLMGAGAGAGSPPGTRGAETPAQPAAVSTRQGAVAPFAPFTNSTPPTPAAACELRLTEHRSGRELKRLPLDPQAPEIRIAFEHSVLGTTVIDRYRFTPAPLLVEEEFEGEGYGLPATAGPGERLERIGTRQRLTLARPVDPLVVRALAGPRMRLLLPQGELLLASLGAPAVALQAVGCTAPQP